MMGSAFSSPTMATVAGKKQLLVQTRERLVGVDPETGDELWSRKIKAFRGMNILTPVLSGERLFTSSYGGGTVALDLKREDEKLAVEEAWSDGAQGYMSTPVVVGDHVYMHLRNRRMTCFNIKTGERTWTTKERFGKYMSLLRQGDRILALDERGLLFLIKANPVQYELIDQTRVSSGESWAHLGVANSVLYVRDLEGLTAYRWQPTTEGLPPTKSFDPVTDGRGKQEIKGRLDAFER